MSTYFSLHVGGGWWLVWSASWALKWSCLPLSPVVSLHVGVGVGWCGRLLGLWSGLVSHCLRLSPFMSGVGVGWCGRLLGLWSGLVSRCLRLSPFMWGVCFGWCGLLGLWSGLVSRCVALSPVVGWVLVGVVGFLGSEVVLSPIVSGCLPSCGGGCWLVWLPSWALQWSCLPLSPVVSLHVGGVLGSEVVLSPVVSGCLPSCGGWELVGVVGFLGPEVVLSPVVSGCLPSCGGWVLVGVVGFLGSEVVLSPVVSRCLPLSPVVSLHVGVGVGWCGRHLGLWSVLSPVVPVVSLHVGGGCWLVWSASWALKWSCLPLSPVVSGCLPSCGGRVLLGVAASRTETFSDQTHRLQSKFAYCKLFGVYAGVILCTFEGFPLYKY